MGVRTVFSGLVAVGLAFGLLPLGCGAAEEEYTVVQHPQEQTAQNVWAAPEGVVEQLRTCVKEHASELKTHSHDAKFEVKVTERGEVQGVKVRSSTLHHDAMESCMMQALATLTIPSSVFPMRSSEPVSGGESMRHDKGPFGVVQAAGGLVTLGPIIIIAGGAVIGVYILAVAAEEAIEAAKRTKKLERWCQALANECLGSKRLPPGSDFGTEKDCGACYRLCTKEGYWDGNKCPRPN